MVTVRRAASLVALILGAISLATPVAGAGDHIARITLNGVIDQVNAAYIQQALQTAADDGAAAAILEIDSPGGELFSTDTIDKAILASKIPVITYVSPAGARAGSAATFVTLAGDVAAMAPSTVIGAASVVDQNGNNLQSTEAAKVTNDAVARIRELATNHDRNADWAESAVREAASIGAPTAVSMKPPVVDILAANETDLLAAIDKGTRADGHAFTHGGQPLPKLSALPITSLDMNIGQQLLHLLSDPNVAFILFTIGFYGILTELFHPNLISGSLGAIAIILAWIGSNSLPLNIGGLALILVGIALFVLELHFTSYGFLAVGGVVCFILGASALYTGVTPGQQAVSVQVSPILLGIVILLTLFYFYVLIRGVIQIRRRTPRAPLPIAALMGAGGTAQTLLAPRGIAYAGGETWSARSPDVTIPPGAPIKVVGVDGLELIVEPAPAGDTPEQGGEAKEGPSNA
jgi:membrane-bound serine protease (ClpP class)